MRIQLVLLSLFLGSAFAADQADMNALFMKYDLVMLKHQVELADEVFSKKFFDGHGGKAEFIEKVKELPKSTQKSLPFSKIEWKPGVKGNMFFAKLPKTTSNKSNTTKASTEFIVVEEDGKLKIDGTLSDGE